MSFSSLPLETKWQIWGYLLPDDEPEICLLWPLSLGWTDLALEPLLVDTGFPVLMHICRESRQFVLSPPAEYKGRVPGFRFSLQAHCRVPYRRFRPELDILYISRSQVGPHLHTRTESWRLISNLSHLAVDANVWSDYEWFTPFILHCSGSLKTVSIVFPSADSDRYALYKCAFQVPSRRCRLETVPNADQLWMRMPKDEKESFRGFIEEYWEAMTCSHGVWNDEVDNHDGRTDWYTGDTWDPVRREYKNIPRNCCVFVQYRRGEDSQELWEQVCKDRRLPGWTYISPAPVYDKMPDPEQFRPNDLDVYPSLPLHKPHRFSPYNCPLLEEDEEEEPAI